MDIRIDPHTLARLPVRGITLEEVERVLRHGRPAPAAGGRFAKELIFRFDALWRGVYYEHKKVKVIYVEEAQRIVTVTAFAYYGFWGSGA